MLVWLDTFVWELVRCWLILGQGLYGEVAAAEAFARGDPAGDAFD